MAKTPASLHSTPRHHHNCYEIIDIRDERLLILKNYSTVLENFQKYLKKIYTKRMQNISFKLFIAFIRATNRLT